MPLAIALFGKNSIKRQEIPRIAYGRWMNDLGQAFQQAFVLIAGLVYTLRSQPEQFFQRYLLNRNFNARAS